MRAPNEADVPPVPHPVAASTSRAGHSAGRLMPEPPESKGDEPLPAGTALAHVKDAIRVTAAGGASAVPAGKGSSPLLSGGSGISLPALGPACEVLAATGYGTGGTSASFGARTLGSLARAAPVIVPAGMMSEPPGSQGDEPKPAGTATRSAGRSDRPASLQQSGISFFSSPRGARPTNSAGRSHRSDLVRVFFRALFDDRVRKV